MTLIRATNNTHCDKCSRRIKQDDLYTVVGKKRYCQKCCMKFKVKDNSRRKRKRK